MIQDSRKRWLGFALTGTAGLILLTASWSGAQTQSDHLTNVNVSVRDAQTDKPLFQARLTLQFQYREPGALSPLKRTKTLTFTGKTDVRGRYRFAGVSWGNVRLIVTAPDHQTFSKEFLVDKDNPLFEVKLKRPQPLL